MRSDSVSRRHRVLLCRPGAADIASEPDAWHWKTSLMMENREIWCVPFPAHHIYFTKISHSLELLTCLTSGSPCNQRIVSASARNTNHVRHQWCSIPLVWYPRCMRSGVWYAPPVAAPTFLIYITITDGYVGTSYT